MATGRPSGGNPADATQDERRIFEQELVGLRPWRRGANRISSVDFQPEHEAQPAAPSSREPRSLHPPVQGSSLRVEAGEATGTAFGVSRETVNALRKGDLRFEARCDLHKLRAEAARRRLHQFVDDCVRRRVRTALVICGRGVHSGPEGPVLARLVTELLARPPIARHVLAFTPAPAGQGGQGAVAVLFRRAPPSP